MGEVLPEEFDFATKAIENDSRIVEYFGDEWLKKLFLIKDRKLIHPLFWVLVNDKVRDKTINNLELIQDKCSKFDEIMGKLRRNKSEFISILSEVEVLAYLYQIYDEPDIEYEPTIHETGKELDVRITKDEVEYFIEVRTVFKDHFYTSTRNLHDRISDALNEIEHPYIIGISTEIGFIEENIHGFVEFVKDIVQSNDEIENGTSFDYIPDGDKIAEFTVYHMSIGSQGFVGASMQPARVSILGDRIKDKLYSAS